MRSVPDWLIQASWWASGIFATGAAWYFLSTKEYGGAAVSAVCAIVLAGVAIALHKKKDALAIGPGPVLPEPPVESTERLQEPRELTIGCFRYPPLMDWHSEAGDDSTATFSGPMVSLANEVAKHIGVRLKWKHIVTHEFLRMELVDVDLVLGLFRTRRREEFFNFSTPLYRIGLQGVCRAASPPVSKEALVKGDQKIVVQEGEVGWEFVMNELQRAERKANVYKVNSIATHEMLDLLTNEKYEIAIADEVSCMHFLRGIGQTGKFRLAFARPPQIFDVCIATKRSVGLDMASLNIQLQRIRNDSSFLEREAHELEGFEHVIDRCGLQ